MQAVKLDIFYPYPPERVWRALTNPGVLASWLMQNDFEPRLGHQFQFRDSSVTGLGRTIHCEVIELDEPYRLVYTWQDNPLREPSLVIWTLIPVEGGTQLQLKHQELCCTVAAGAIAKRETVEQSNRGTVMFFDSAISNSSMVFPEQRLLHSHSAATHEQLPDGSFNLRWQRRWKHYLTEKLSNRLSKIA